MKGSLIRMWAFCKNVFAPQSPQAPPPPLTEAGVQRLLDNARDQMEAYVNLHLFFTTGQLLPTLHGWPISPDFAVQLIRLLQAKRYDVVLEFGSGASTLITAKTLQINNCPNARHVVFDHEDAYLQKTRQLLPPELASKTAFHWAPLIPFTEGNEHYRYYDCSAVLAECAQQLRDQEPLKLLVIVDGPPGNTCKHARYPLLPLVLAAFPHIAQLDILLDDYARPDEQQVGEKWISLLKTTQFTHSKQSLPLEKGALLLQCVKKM